MTEEFFAVAGCAAVVVAAKGVLAPPGRSPAQIAEGLDMARLKEATDEEKEAAVREMVPVGSDLFVKIVDVVPARADEETGAPLPAKVSCSAKVVDQASGRDLDPTGERAAAGGRGGGAAKAAAAAAAGASVGAVAQKGEAVGWGHLAAEKYKGASGKSTRRRRRR